MKIIRARIRNGKLTDPVNRHDLDGEITEGRDGRLALVVVFDDPIAFARGSDLRGAENAVREAFGLPTVAE